MKKILKAILSFVFKMFEIKDNKKIMKKIQNYKYISFDIFDTLIKRDIFDEKNIFDIVQSRYNKKNNNVIKEFKHKRIMAEDNARIKKSSNEVTLDEIYSEMPFSKEINYKLKEIEVETEIEYCKRNDRLFEIFEYCKKNDKKIFITSDMYLDQSVIEKILSKNGYTGYEKLYLSGNLELSKSKGNIFDLILKENKIQKNEMLHIGDNAKSDYIIPKLKGISAVLIKKYIKISEYITYANVNKNISSNVSIAVQNNLSVNKNFYEKLGISLLGPILYGFCVSLHKYVQEKNLNNIFFLARDAKIIEEAYFLLFPEDRGKCRYLYVSRKSTSFINIDETCNLKEFEDSFKSIIVRKKVSEIIEILEVKSKKNIINIDKNAYYDDLSYNDRNDFFNIIKEDLVLFCEQQRKKFKLYLEQNNFNGDVCLVDIGWKGTIQKNIENFCKKNNIKVSIYGYYMGIYEKNDYREAYLYNGSEKRKYEIYLSVGFFETMFLNNEGTTLYYVEENKKIIPYKANYEQTDNIKEYMKNMQVAALMYVKNTHKEMNEINMKDVYDNYRNTIIRPKLSFLKKINKIKFNDGVEYTLINSKSLIYYVFHLKQFKNDLMDSYYKIGFMKKVFKIQLPYIKILTILYDKAISRREKK